MVKHFKDIAELVLTTAVIITGRFECGRSSVISFSITFWSPRPTFWR